VLSKAHDVYYLYIQYFAIAFMRMGLSYSLLPAVAAVIIIIATLSLLICSASLAIQALGIPTTITIPNHPVGSRSEVPICHISPGNPANGQTITIDEAAVQSHLRNHPGDTVGQCTTNAQSPNADDGNNNNKVIICHVPPGNPTNGQTITIGPKAAEAHLRNHPGDHTGPCAASAQPTTIT
jgi:hypothetical protein